MPVVCFGLLDFLQEFSDPRDADDARYDLDGRKFDGSRIVVEFARGVSCCLSLFFTTRDTIFMLSLLCFFGAIIELC